MTERITATTRVFALLGDPVEHSLSPVIQNTAFRESGVDGVYVALHSDQPNMVAFINSIAHAGGGGNITLPHKERAAAVVEVATGAVRRTGACNTFWFENGKVHGDNTDVEGFRRALHRFLSGSAAGARVLLLGAGGAARAALLALIEDQVDHVEILNRSTERARAVARRIGGERVRVCEARHDLDGETFDLVVNTTRLGLDTADPAPFDLDDLGRVGGVMDLVYRARETRFVREARERGIRAEDGGEMLVQQGAAAFERWWMREPSIDAMRAALRSVRMR